MITEFMIKEHEKILRILEELELFEVSDKEKIEELLQVLNFSLENHFFLEEKVIFKAYSSNNEGNIEGIIKQHKNVLWLLKKIKDNVSEKNLEYLNNLKKLLIQHMNFETDNFYPKLDSELSDGEKCLILENCNKLQKNHPI